MRKNHKRRVKTSVFPRSVTGLIIVAVGLMLAYWGLDSKCAQLGDELRKSEAQLQKLNDEFQRENARWKSNLTTEKLSDAMLHHGLAMSYPKADQIVRMDRKGVPVTGQRSLAKYARDRQSTTSVAEK